ncbi:hypothetical protein TVAG_188340 [Trichomonas vaginalis G3]|uniref:Uncharacterized protein n=1 Tax=Trichomonas vaginalis (strain ATCC PRA-98 / G3) TaxID=412133 RepID=A2DV56_TRIV3|nr:hypothetical protein TVAGG3_0941180 [Trichomonas vaginalis G3]EAY15783.1 hypothetical protein TVAG_188340 [Trichomonas vaginalis G3]KAI5486554.1 hypothetical protein TVAGG3_0941180 [Trichomonas vaginalis G3]|eukprot:XP_001328006.1 hypothetical protein [Trichomonas vaginalis G3]
MENPESVCLNVAEKILLALDDKTIFKRYLSEKNQLSTDKTRTKTQISISSFTKSISNDMPTSNKENNQLYLAIIQEIENLQNQILPSTPVTHHNDLDDALKSLLSVIDTQFTSHQFLKHKLMCENVKLKQAISNIKEVSLNDIQENRKKRIENDENWAERKARILELEKAAQLEKKKLSKQIEKLKIDNKELQTQIEQTETQYKNRQALINDASAEIESLDETISTLKEQATQFQYELELTNKANQNLDSIQKFRISNGGGLKNEKERLIQELDELKRRNNMLMAELPKTYK